MTNLTSLSARASKGFTLAELLIALAILGVIATFTIPKILSSSQNGQNTSIAKEAASMVSSAFQNYTLDNGLASGATAGAFTTYMNYVTLDSTSTYTGSGGTALQTCSTTLMCMKLHNGAVLQYDTAQTFGSTASPSAVTFNLDPDGNGTQGRITFIQYANGRMTTGANNTPTATHGAAGTITKQATDPGYLSNWN
jgi:prepilin-type N-terminal cleavage/methylation domain-containing protein